MVSGMAYSIKKWLTDRRQRVVVDGEVSNWKFDMKVSEQCGITASKGNQIIGLIRKIITYKEKR